MLLSARPLKFKYVGSVSIEKTDHVREESLFSNTFLLSFERLRVVKEAENNVAISVTARGERLEIFQRDIF